MFTGDLSSVAVGGAFAAGKERIMKLVISYLRHFWREAVLTVVVD